MDRGPLLTSAIIFYLAIGAAIFEVLEEPHWKEAKKNYYTQKLHLLKEFPCLGQEGLDKILQVSHRFAPTDTPEAGWCFRGAEGTPLTALDDRQSLWVVLGVTGQDVSSWIWLLGFVVHPWTQESPTCGDSLEPSLFREDLGLTPR